MKIKLHMPPETERLIAELKETRLCLGEMLRAFKFVEKTDSQKKKYENAQYILRKYSKPTDALK